MSSPKHPALQPLDRFDDDQLSSILDGENYRQCVPTLQRNDKVWLVEYLDRVRRHVALPTLRSNQRRPSIVSILPVLLPRSVYVNSEAFAAPR